MALSRVRRLSAFKSVGLTTKVRALIEGGPPETIPAQFEKYFAEKETATKREAEKAMRRLAWL